MTRMTTCIWSNYTAEEQAAFYTSLIPDSRIVRIERTPIDTPNLKAGEVILAVIELAGHEYLLLNGGPMFPQTEAVSFIIHTPDQAETDRLWAALTADGGAESQCGWCKDRWGVNWQVTPDRLMELVWDNPNKAAAQRAMLAMMPMKKIDIATIEAAASGETVSA
ncbi:VOC family protein [Sphingomonas sp.]|uniref:VOC family protein n=1 Tax=Sphingomonas sp. TaxID=28214 RepID=UPI00181C4B9F|nr:VOC family protein [Sphingomonas sp.]MBA4762034.1 VOC family protein [Sphingomonas sp.]